LPLLGLFQRAVKAASSAGVAETYKAVFKLVLELLDTRRLEPADRRTAVLAVENATLGLFFELALKLNEAAFRPLLLVTIDWACRELVDEGEGASGAAGTRADAAEPFAAGVSARKTVLFRLLDRLLGQLKSIVAPYFAYVLEEAVDTLDAFAAGQLADLDLWDATVSATTKALLHGSDGASLVVVTVADAADFWTANRTNRLIEPCTRQLTLVPTLGGHRVVHRLNPLLVQLGLVASDNDALLKLVNAGVLRPLLTLDAAVEVKRSCLAALAALWTTVGGGAMASLVAETIPALVQQDEVELAEPLRRAIAAIEGVTGESLEDALS